MLRRRKGPGSKLLGGALALAVAGAGGACGTAASSSGRVSVVAAFYPLEFAARAVGGAAVDVTNLTPPGVEPHDLELSPRQVGELSEADLVVYVGNGFQPTLDDAVAQIDGGSALNVLSGEDLLTPADEASSEVTDAIGEPSSDSFDPHVWLDPVRMRGVVARVETALSEADPSNADAFRKAAGALDDRLSELDRTYSTGLSHCASRYLVTSHAAFGYLAKRYGLTQVSVSGLDPEAEPTPGRLAAIARFVEGHDATTIFGEELAPPEIAETLSREAGVEIEILSPLESAPASGDYFTAMQTNLDRIRQALGCD